jgi:hypothetical protein
MPQDSRRGGAVAGVLLAILLVGFLVIVAAVSTGLYVAQNVRVTERGSRGETAVETPFGSVRVREHNSFDPAHLGLPVYPGAERMPDSRKFASLRLDIGHEHRAFAALAAEYRTSDSVEKVTEFYRHELPHWLISEKDGGRFELSLTHGGYKRIVSIREDGFDTHIALASIGEPASN